MKRATALLMIVSLLAMAFAVPAGAEERYETARTSLEDASERQLTNISLTVNALDQCVVDSGETFSFNETVGPRTEENGYVRAVNGRGAKVMGGGVAQVATTMYLALSEIGGVRFGEIDTYGSRFTGSYVADGDLAVITDYNAGHDLSFTNENDSPLRVALWMSESYLYCTVSLEEQGGMTFDEAETNWFLSSPDVEDRGSWKTATVATAQLDCGSEANVKANAALAADSIYDTTLAHGDEFSFNGIVGPREERYGYRSATNGRGVKVTGGGVAQVASVVWLAVKDMDDVSIIEKSTYGDRYNQSYVRSSADAILTDYNAGTDFAFRYDGAGSITIYTWLEGSTLYCSISANG